MKNLIPPSPFLQTRVERHPLLASFLLVLTIVVVAVYTVPPHFETNDDVAFMLMVSGRVLSPEPTGWIFFIHFLLSQTLAWLYRLNANVPWYGLMHLGSLTLAYWVILYAVLLKGFSWQRVSLFLLCLTSLGLPFALSLQFTKTAFLVGISSVLLLATTLQQYFSRSTNRVQLLRRLAAVTLLLMLALLIRRESLHLVGVLSIPVFGWLAWSAWKSQEVLFFLTLLASLGLILVLLDSAHSRKYQQDPAWKRFSVLNPVKSEFLDYRHIPYTDASQPYFQEVGWSENDYQCLLSWWYIDPYVYSPEKMHAIAVHFPLTARSSTDISTALRSLARHCLAEGTTWVVVPLCMAVALLGLWSLPARLVLLATFGGAGLTLVLLAVFLKLPPYICQAILITPGWVALWLSDNRQELGPASSWRFVRPLGGGLLVGVVLLVLLLRADTPLAKAITGSRITVQNNGDLRTALLRLNPTPTQTFVAWGDAFPYEAILPLEPHGYLRNLRVVAVAAGNQSPVQQRMFETQGITDLHRALFERKDVFLSLRSNDAQGVLLIRYLAEHYGVTVTLATTFNSPPLRFWEVTRVPSPSSVS
jgi:hypothetical protein